ncbi:HAD family hydrolase [Leptotrichia sp. OH3620_COT-345]|uniref:HAD family hydrolase n=1 Tax=Leptotrichia sp. OH3620_COT-345 TaxID=2491048 RepID=UPI000F65371D|nr:HAD family hydrolase [Leptotrichia sp. OH3620_COT-345]RRD39411.1 HAD family hydrolase [Leptotrichia sp. OH3620_COT-345]
MYKAVISDLDGTLLNENHLLNDFTIETVRKITEKGIKFYIATGRSYFGAKEIMEKINLKIPLITSNGARIMNNEGKEIYINNIDKKYLEKIYEVEYKKIDKDIIMNGYSGSNWYIVEDVLDYYIKQRPDRLHLPKIINENEFYNKDYTKIFFLGEHDKLLKLEKIIKKVTAEEVNVVFVSERSLEIFAKNSNKATAAKYLLQKDGIKLSEAVAFGDGYNDYELLKEAGKGYLMGNSLYRLIEGLPKHEIIESNVDDGVAKKLRELFL